jgi:hypothetical protein
MDLGREYSACFTPDAGVAESATLEVLRARRLPTDQVAVPQFKTGQKRDWHSRDGQSGHDWALDQPWMHTYRIAQHGADGAGRPPGNRPAMVHRVAAIIIGGGVERKSVTESSTPSMRRFLPHLSQLYFCYKRQKPNWKMPAHRKRHPFRRRQKFSQDHRKNSGCTRSIRPKL